jgi:hypothetical protein
MENLRKNVILIVEDVVPQAMAMSTVLRNEFSNSMVVAVYNFESAKRVIVNKQELRKELEKIKAENKYPLYKEELKFFDEKPLFNIACIVLDMVDDVNRQMMGNDLILYLKKRREECMSEFIQVVLYSGQLRPEKIKDVLPVELQNDNANKNDIKLYLAKTHGIAVVEKGEGTIGIEGWKPYDLYYAIYPNLQHYSTIIKKKIEILAKDVVIDNFEKDGNKKVEEILKTDASYHSWIENMCNWK